MAERHANRSITTRAQAERLWSILAMIQNDPPVTAPKLARHFEVTVRTIRRDIEFLRERMGIEVGYDESAKTFVVDSDFTHIPPLELGEADFLLLSYLQQCIAQHSETDIGRMMNESFEKLFGILTGSKRWAEFARNIDFRFGLKSSSAPGREAKNSGYYTERSGIPRRSGSTISQQKDRVPHTPSNHA